MIYRIVNRKRGVFVLTIFGAVVLLVAVGLVLGHRITEQRYGLSLAPEVSHEAFATNEDRVRLVIRPEFLLPYLEHYLPEEGETNTTGPSTAELFRELLPREIALLARSDLSTDKIYLTLFANERRGGPSIQARINHADVLSRMSGVEWITEGLELRDRGILIAQGSLVLPASPNRTEGDFWPIYDKKLVMRNSQWVTEATLLEYWPERVNNLPRGIKGDHFMELVVDNTNGDMLTFFSVVAAILGEDWSQVVCFLFPMFTIVYSLVGPLGCYEFVEFALSIFMPIITTISLTMEITNSNSLLLHFVIEASEEYGPHSEFILSYSTFPQLARWLQENFNLILNGSLQLNETENHIVGTYTLTGIQPIFENITGFGATLFRNHEAMFNLAYRLILLLQH